MKNKNPRVLFFDIETMYLKAHLWQPGQQYVGHKQLLHSHKMWDLICIQYCWDDGKPVKVLRYDKHGGTKGMLVAFDKLIREADIVLGKNSDRFDIKMLNSLRMFHGLPGNPEWSKYSEDLEKQMRRYFRLPSQSLDYISDMCGVGGKVQMSIGDWKAISEMRELDDLKAAGLDAKAQRIFAKHMFGESPSAIRKLGKDRLNHMCEYGAKDTDDTRILWHKLKEHFDPKFNVAVWKGEKHACKLCGSKDIKKNGKRVAGKTTHQHFYCNSHGGYAGRAPISKHGVVGQIG
jgi:hypothetical protein